MFIPLGIKTDYEILLSLIKVNDLVKFAKDNNLKAIGVIDNNLSYVMEFYKECLNNEIKPIIGLEVSIEDKIIYLYAKSYKGYQNLCYISNHDKSLDLIKNNIEDLLCILPNESIDLYDKLNIPDTYICYEEDIEKDDRYKYIYMNTVRCFKEEDKEYLKYLSLIKDGKKLEDETIIYNNPCMRIKKPSKDEISNYEDIFNICNVVIKKSDLLPEYELPVSSSKYLEELSKKGLSKRLNNKVPIKYAERLEKELKIINEMGFCDYFLVVWDYVKYAKKNGILVGPGRGSAASSLVSYSLGITEIDPLKYDLLFERFLNPERVTMPDIDVDFESTRKEEVINYVRSKYGNNRVSSIITFGTYKPKMVLRDVGRLFDLDSKIDSFIKLFDSDISLEDNLNNTNIKSIMSKDTMLSRIVDISKKLEGLKRHTSTHAAGVVISSKDLDRYIPLMHTEEGNISYYTMNYLEELGLLKMDFLSLDNLILISELVKETGINLRDIPLDDEKTFEIFRNIKTDGIFQFESPGIKNVLRKYQVRKFDDLAAILALFRPGPMDNIDTYIKRMLGKEKIDYIHEDLKPILESTYGIIVYQEQIIMIANKMAGFSLGEADILRRAMSKKNAEMMNKQKEKFIKGSINNGYSEEISTKVFDYIYKFASYGFNKAHSVSYSFISYQMAYLKAHYMDYYMKYLLTMVLGNDIKTKDYINECKLNNIDIIKPDINKSTDKYIDENRRIRFPISEIKGVGMVACSIILKERENGLYKDYLDFVSRVYKKGVNRKVITALIYSGSLDLFGKTRKTLIENLDNAINYAELVSDLDPSLVDKPELEEYEEYSKDELTEQEFLSFNFYLSYHPVQKYRQNKITTLNIKENFNKNIDIYLMVDKKREVITKKNEKMLFITGSDEYKDVELVVFPKVYEKFYYINLKDVYKFNAKVERRGAIYQLIVNNIEKL